MRCIGATEGGKLSSFLFPLSSQAVFDGFQIAFGEDDIGIQNDEPFAMGALGSVVAGLSRSSVLLDVIMQIKDVCELVANILARFL